MAVSVKIFKYFVIFLQELLVKKLLSLRKIIKPLCIYLPKINTVKNRPAS
jgi:hypothetical protein